MTEHIRANARTARLEAAAGPESTDDPDFSQENAPWEFSGVAVAENDILRKPDGTPVLFTPDELAARAETQAERPLTKDHPTDENGDPAYPPPTDETIGDVPKAGHVGGKGMVYSAKTHDPDIAAGVYAGSYDVSVHPRFNEGDVDPETGAVIAEDSVFLDLSVVSDGDSDHNTAEWGPSRELAAWTHSEDFGDELAAATSGDPDAENAPSNLDGRDADSLWRMFGRKIGALSADAGGEPGGDADGEDEQGGDGPADTGSDADEETTASSNMVDIDRETLVQAVASKKDLDEDTLGELSDEALQTLYMSAMKGDDGSDDGGEDGEDGEDGGSGEGLDPEDLEAAVGMDEDRVREIVAEERENAEMQEAVANVAEAEDLDEETVASEWPAEAIESHEANSAPDAAAYPGGGGVTGELEAGAIGGEDGDDALDDYDTGVAGE